MNVAQGASLDLSEGRFSRFQQIRWWKQSVLSEARILVVGAGALGNEVLKNLALLGVGNVAVIDMDRIEASNLSRSVLFRETNEGELKSTVAARVAKEIYPAMNVHALVGNVLADVGLGMVVSVSALLLEEMSFHIYPKPIHTLYLFAVALAENVGYRQLNSMWRLIGLVRWLSGEKASWGDMTRVASWQSR